MYDKQKKLKNLLRRGALVLAAAVLGVSVYHWNALSLMGNALPMPFGYGMATVLSGSMEPRLSIDDLVVIRETDTVEENDIIVYQAEGRLIIHRVLEVDGDTIHTMGDANNKPDEPITMADVKGVLVLDIPAVGIVVRFLRRPLVVALLLGAVVLLTEVSYRKEKDRDTAELEAIQREIRMLLDEAKEEQGGETNGDN